MEYVVLNENECLRSGGTCLLGSVRPIPCTECSANFYSNRIIRIWNSLPEDLRIKEVNENGNNSTFEKEVKMQYARLVHVHFENSEFCTWTTCAHCRK